MNKKFLSAALFGTLLAASTGTFTSCKDYDDDINGLQEQVDANKKTLDEKLTALQTAMDKANTEVTAAKAAAAAAQAAADKAAQAAAAAAQAAAQAKVDAIAEATRLVNELKVAVDKKVDKSVYDAKMQLLDASISVINGKLETLTEADKAINLQIEALKGFKAAIEALNLTTAFPELQGKVATLIADLGTLQTKVAQNETDIAGLKTELQTLSTRIGSIEENVTSIGNKLNTLSSLLSHRLTSLTFVPSTFINGVEVINFATLEYKAWTKLLADKTDGTKASTINDGKTQAFYYANPTSINKEDITKLTILTQDATNITRAASGPSITATLDKIEADGKMVINLKKNSKDPFTDSNVDGVESFTLVALKADIKTTQEEIDNGLQPTVVSDWARLAETKVTPRIHNTAYENGKKYTENFATGVIPHFYPYTTIYDAAISSTDGKFIIKEIEYTKTLDLNTLVGVCSGENNVKHNAADYGLAFEFALVDYKLKQGAEEETNQKLFAKIADGVISSQARNGQTNNKDAIGREPMVQVVLKNTANGEVVDVRYFKIKWTVVKEVVDLGNLGEYTGTFDKTSCAAEYLNMVKTATMNDVYAKLNMSNEQFHHLNTLDRQVYATLAAAKAGTPSASNLGTIEDIAVGGSTVTHNLKWTFPIADNTITAAEYEAGKAVRKVYGRYTNTVDGSAIYPFELTLTLNITKMAFAAGYIQTYWSEGSILSNTNKDKVFQVNPALTSDATYGNGEFYDCQIIADMLKGYNKTGGTINRPLDLVSNADAATLVFDADRLIAKLGADWTCTDGFTLKKNGVIAATINNGIIRLHENPLPGDPYRGILFDGRHGKPTTAAQELLGKNVPVKLVASYCNGAQVLKAELDHFLVNFITPLEMTLSDVTESFKDLMTNGSTIDVSNVATVKELFGNKRTVVNAGDRILQLNELVRWYNVENITWDINSAKTSLKIDGDNIIITNNPQESDWSLFKAKYSLTAASNWNTTQSLTFKNNSGAHIQQAFQIAIPVYAKTKWSAQLSKQYVILTVNPGTTAK